MGIFRFQAEAGRGKVAPAVTEDRATLGSDLSAGDGPKLAGGGDTSPGDFNPSQALMSRPPESDKIELPAPPLRVTPSPEWLAAQQEKQRVYEAKRAAWRKAVGVTESGY